MQSANTVSIYAFLVKKLSIVRKRRRFILSTVLLTGLVTWATFFGFENLAWTIPILALSVYTLTFFSILEGIDDKEWLMLFIHPVIFTVVIYLFYFFLPGRWLTRLPFAVIYSISIYAILLSQNIFNVGVEKSLQLFRAAESVNFLYLTITLFASLSLLFSFHMNFVTNAVATSLLVFPISLHFLWTIDPRAHLEQTVVKYAIFVACIVGEVAGLFSFVPINPLMFALLTTSLFYSLSGLLQAHIQGRMFPAVVREYTFVMVFIGGIVLLSLQW